MGIFGKSNDPSKPSFAERAAIFASIAAGDDPAAAFIQRNIADRARRSGQDQFLNTLTDQLQPGYSQGPQIGVTVPEAGQAAEVPQFQLPQRTRDPININSPNLPALAVQAQRLGIPLNGLLDVLKAQQPDVHYDRGYGYNSKTGQPAGDFHTDLDKGMRPGPNGTVGNAPGYVDAAAEAAGAVTGAQERAKAPYTFPTFKGPDGRDITVSAATAAALGSKGGMISQGQSPAEASAAKAKADAQAAAQIALPQTVNSATQALTLIGQLKSSPVLKWRTGALGLAPATPGTAGADFDAMSNQLKGKVFLEAFSTLKGGGQITEVEGQKATQAIARLNQTQTTEGYVSALSDLESVIKSGLQRAQNQAGGGGSTAPPPKPSDGAAILKGMSLAERMALARQRGLIK